MINTERVYCLVVRWHSAMCRKFDSGWDLEQAVQSIVHLIKTFPDAPTLEIMEWVAGTIEDGQGPNTFGDIADVSSPMELIRNQYRGFHMVSAICPIRC